MQNKVQLIGNTGNDPVVKTLDSGRKVANLTIATKDFYKNEKKIEL